MAAVGRGLKADEPVSTDYWGQYQAPQYSAQPGGQRYQQTAPATTTTAPTGGGGEDPQAVFNELMQGQPITLEALRAIEPELQRRTGARFENNARGTAADLVLPSGEYVDVVSGFDGPEGGRSLQWLREDPRFVPGAGGATGGAGYAGGVPPGYEMGTFTGGGSYPLASVMAPGLMQPWTTPFQRPTLSEETDPGYLARLDMGRQAIERSAAARGTLRTGGTLKDLTQYGQDYGSSEYDKVYNRTMGEYQTAYGIYDRNQANQFNRLQNVASMGQNAATMAGNQASSYGNNVGNIYTQQGNVQAAGTVGSANANAALMSGAANAGLTLANAYIDRNRKPPVAA